MFIIVMRSFWKDTGLKMASMFMMTKYYLGKGIDGDDDDRSTLGNMLHIYWDDRTKTQQFDFDTHKCGRHQSNGPKALAKACPSAVTFSTVTSATLPDGKGTFEVTMMILSYLTKFHPVG